VPLPTSHLSLILLAALVLLLVAGLLLPSRTRRKTATAPPPESARKPVAVPAWNLAGLAVLFQVAVVLLVVWAVVFGELADGASSALSVLAFFAAALCICWLYTWRHGAFDPDPPGRRLRGS